MSLLDSSPTSDELMSWENLKALVAANGASIARLCAKLGVKVDAPRESTPPPTAPICVQGDVGALPVLVETPSTPALQPCIVPKPRPSTPTKCSMECLDDETCQVMPTLLRDLSFPAILLPPMRKGNEQHKWLPPTHMKVAEDNGERPRPWPSFVGRPCQELMLMPSPFFMTCHSGVHQKQFWPPPQGIPLKFVSKDMQEVLGCPVSSSALPMLSYGAKSYFQFKCFFPGSMKMVAQCLALLPSVNPAIYPPWRPPDRETHQAMIPGFPRVALSPNVHGDLSGWHSAFFHEKNDNGWLCVLHVLLSALAHFQWQIPWPSPQGCCAILSLWETYCSGHKLLQICSVNCGLVSENYVAEFWVQPACALNWMSLLGFINSILDSRTIWLGIQVAANGNWWSFSWDQGEHNTCVLTLHFLIHHAILGQVELFDIRVQFVVARALSSMWDPDHCQLQDLCEFKSDDITSEFFAGQHIRPMLTGKPWDPGRSTYCHLSTFAVMDCHATINLSSIIYVQVLGAVMEFFISCSIPSKPLLDGQSTTSTTCWAIQYPFFPDDILAMAALSKHIMQQKRSQVLIWLIFHGCGSMPNVVVSVPISLVERNKKCFVILGRPGPVMFFFVSYLGRILGGASLMSNFWPVQKQHHVPSLDEILPAHLLGLNAHQIPLPLSALFSRASDDQMRLECSMVIFLQMFSTKRCLTQDIQEHWVGEEQLLS